LNAHNPIMMMVLGLAIIPTKLTFFFTRQIKSRHIVGHYLRFSVYVAKFLL
jgi:hypothetical protein